MEFQTIAVIIIAVAAVAGLLRKYLNVARNKGSCGCGGHCGAGRELCAAKAGRAAETKRR